MRVRFLSAPSGCSTIGGAGDFDSQGSRFESERPGLLVWENGLFRAVDARIMGRNCCVICGAPCLTRARVTCSAACHGRRAADATRSQHRKENERFIARWRAGDEPARRGLGVSKRVRAYLFDKFGGKCVQCGWCVINTALGYSPLEIDHIDGDWRNNTENNLRLVCPNCHALTPTYRNLNKGRGRSLRRSVLPP